LLKDFDFECLLAKARRQDAHALSALCELFYPKLLKFLHYRVGPDHAEDLAGEVVLKIMRSIAGQTGSFEPWLYRVAKNVIVDHARRLKARPETPLDEEMLNNMTRPENLIDDVARQLDLQHGLAQLTDDQRELLTLKFIQGLSNAEIGEVTGRNSDAVRALQFRALTALRQALEGERCLPT
jgi:RNA polymerase sigma-70 factor (ECF subfamily)